MVVVSDLEDAGHGFCSVFAAFLQRFCSDFSVQLSSGETVPSPGIPASKSIMAPGERHQAHPFFEVAAAGQQVEGFFYEGLRVQRDQVGLVLVDALVVGRVERPGFLRRQSEVGKALAAG